MAQTPMGMTVDGQHQAFFQQGVSKQRRSGISRLSDNTIAGLAIQRNNVLVTRCEHMPFRNPQFMTAGFLYRAGAETPPPKDLRDFQVSPRMIFSAADTQTAVLVSTAKAWISAPDTQTSILGGFLRVPKVPVTKTRVSAPAPLHYNPTVILHLPESMKLGCCFAPPFLSVKNSCISVLRDLVKAD